MALEEIESSFFEHLKAEFEASAPDMTSPQAQFAAGIIQRYQTDPTSMVASDVYALDMLIIGMQPTERLIQRAPALRDKYHEILGDKFFASYNPAAFPPPDKLDDGLARRPLLADLQQILHVLHWSYVFGPIREGIRTHLIQVAIKYIIFYSAFWIGFVLLFWYIGHPFLAVGATVIYCGLIGGFVSSQRRMQTIPTGGDPLTSIYELKNGQYFLWFAPLTGGIFALVLMLIFMGRILQGIIFPEFSNLDPGRVLLQVIHGNNWVFTSTLLPKTSADYALLFLWSFIAGFAERFVPDAVDRLTTRAEAASQTPAATPAVVK